MPSENHSRNDDGADQARKGRLPAGFKRRLLRQLLTELAPLLLFFITYMWSDLIWATAVYAAATVAAFALAWRMHRKFPVLPTITAVLVLIFAGLTLSLDDTMFIKIKPTVVNAFYGLALVICWSLGLSIIRRVLEPEIKLDDYALRLLTVRTSAYLIGLAVLNEIVWRSVSTETWVIFKVFVMIAFNITFAVSQFPLVRNHLVAKAG